MNENGKPTYTAGIVLGVYVEVKPKINGGRAEFYLVYPGFKENLLPFSGAFCGGGFLGSSYDLNRPVEGGDLRVLYQSGVRDFSKKEIIPAVLGVRLLHNPCLEFIEMDNLLTEKNVRNIRKRAEEISGILKTLSLPSIPTRVYATGEYENLLPSAK
jgi:hypothetical protein